MKITARDVSLIKDLALSHVMSRDQILQLGYFGSITRLNTRLRGLMALGCIKRLETPFFSQSLYAVDRKANVLVGENIAPLLAHRADSPRFIQHALNVTNVRIHLKSKGLDAWRFEQQLWRTLPGRRGTEIRPDGMVLKGTQPMFIEIDLGTVAASKMRQKFAAYNLLALAHVHELYGSDSLRLLVVTTNETRAANLRRLLPEKSAFPCLIQTFDQLGIPSVQSWS
jgi:hypothetical protein